MVLGEESRDTLKGYRDEPHNRKERHRATGDFPQAHGDSAPAPPYVPLSEKATEDRKVGLPVSAPGTESAKTPDIVRTPGSLNQPGGVKSQFYDKVTEGRLGGGEEVVYDAYAKADPRTGKEVEGLVGVQDRTPRSDDSDFPVAGVDPKAVR